MAQKFRKIHVVKRDNDFFVLPPLLELTGNEDVKLFNHTDEDLLWKVDHLTAFGAPFTESVGPNGQQSTKKTTTNAAGIIVLSYQVIMLASGKKAKGNSDPMIIIDN